LEARLAFSAANPLASAAQLEIVADRGEPRQLVVDMGKVDFLTQCCVSAS